VNRTTRSVDVASPDTNRPDRHSHSYGVGNPLAERRTWQVIALTGVMMVVEIVAGTVFGSLALLADGWHMSSHTFALGIAAGAYYLARRYSSDPRFAFGTWKIEVLGGYTSALLLLGVAAYMGFESIVRLVRPATIHFDEAIPIAIVGLAVNLVSAWLLSLRGGAGPTHAGHDHGHGNAGHGHDHDHSRHREGRHDPPSTVAAARPRHEHHQDMNLRAAYMHVVADAATSVLAIVALIGGRNFGALWLDPVMGLVGTVLVGQWAWGMLRGTGRALLDAEMDAPVVAEIREVVASLPGPPAVHDLHVWRVGSGKYACVLCLESTSGLTADGVRAGLAQHDELVHVTVEINRPD
jgi:cation diffusion facilitator family transporter